MERKLCACLYEQFDVHERESEERRSTEKSESNQGEIFDGHKTQGGRNRTTKTGHPKK